MNKLISDNLSINADGHLCFAGRDTTELAKKYGTPLYLIDEDRIRDRCRIYKKAMREAFAEDALPFFAGKSLCFKGIYRIMCEEKMGIDVVSSGELYTAVSAGFPAERACFHGNNKTDADIEFAMDCGVGYFVCDNREELAGVDREAKKRGLKQKILLRITPGIDPHTFAQVATGKVDSKFGAAVETGQAMDLTREALACEGLELCGFHCHVGSQIFDKEPFADAAKIMLAFIRDVKLALGYEARILNLGGGMAVRYLTSDPEPDYAANIAYVGKVFRELCEEYDVAPPRVFMEPGRSLVADAGMTLYSAGTLKTIPGFKTYVSVDGGMADNPRYALYSSPYTVLLANRANDKEDTVCTVAGRCCESGDLIQENVSLPLPKRGDLVAVLTTGAYNYSMASNYNRLPRPALVMLAGGRDSLAVRRETFEDLVRNDI